ncbi:Uncharacterised protein [Streptococcus pneumoniae]|nr:Uncharacterised protein [Streptococcus pneumoniae]
MTNLLFVSYSSKISSNRVNVFENLFKPRQLRLVVDIVTDFVSSICNLKAVL